MRKETKEQQLRVASTVISSPDDVLVQTVVFVA